MSGAAPGPAAGVRAPLRVAALLLCVGGLAGCSAARPWINSPLPQDAAVEYDGLRQIADGARSPELLVVASFSGGGSRAAALAHAALAELDQVPLTVGGRTTTLAREIDVVTGVSGGSVAAAYLALHGSDRFLAGFGPDFLDVDFGSRIVGGLATPSAWRRLGSRYLGRGNLLAEAFDRQLFEGATFGSLATRPDRPYLIVGATDLASGTEFEFAADQFGRICSSIDAVPLAFAVAASSAVPLVFTPLTLANHGAHCAAARSPGGAAPPAATISAAVPDRYADPATRFIHLVDGGVSDNLGIRRIVDYVAQAGGIENVLRLLAGADGSIARHIVFINVGAERRQRSALDSRRATPGLLQVLGALANGGVGRTSSATGSAFDSAVRSWLVSLRGRPPPLDAVDVYAIAIDLAATSDDTLRERARAIPTEFRISRADRAALRAVARDRVTRAPDLERLRIALGGSVPEGGGAVEAGR